MNRPQAVFILCMFTCVFWLPQAGKLCAQTRSHESKREVIVGELVGRTDVRQLKVLTKQGLLSIAGQGNGKPFSVLRRSKNWVALKFYNFGLKDFNPNMVTIRFFETERALISALILDEVHFAVLESEASALDIRKSNSHYVPLPLPMKPNTVKLIAYNHRNPLFASAEIRTAISYGIDHEYIIKKIIRGGKANLARGPFDDDSPLYNSGMKSYKYNPRLAQRTLVHAGWRDTNRDGILEKDGRPFIMQLYYQKGLRLDEAISRIIKINLIKLGIDVQPKPLTKAEMNDRLALGDFEAVLMDYTFENSVESLRAFFSRNGEMNYCGYSSRTFERYLSFHDEATSQRRKKTLIKSMQNVINQDQPVTFLYFKWLTHYIVNVDRFANFRYVMGPESGQIRPFEEWIIKPGIEK